jgi:hypothetical protein
LTVPWARELEVKAQAFGDLVCVNDGAGELSYRFAALVNIPRTARQAVMPSRGREVAGQATPSRAGQVFFVRMRACLDARRACP